MSGLLAYLGITLRLHFRNKLALLYSYLFPTIFLTVFWVLYRHEPVPLIRHMGELLTVTVLGGACFGLPTALVSERERGVWRRLRLTPVRPETLVGTTVIARYLLLLAAGLLQLGLAMAVFRMPAPQHPLDLLVAFTLVAFAFLGLGLVIAMTADNVPAVQALGQCIFLPMLVIGGVAVRIESLPVWAQHVSTYFPGRYAVEALSASVNGDGLASAGFALFALLLIGAAGFLAGVKLLRWDQQRRFIRLAGKGWVMAAVAAWMCVGLLAHVSGYSAAGVPLAANREVRAEDVAREAAGSPSGPTQIGGARDDADEVDPDTASQNSESVDGEAPPAGSSPASPPEQASQPEQPWQAVTMAEIEAFDFATLPPDQGVISPVGTLDEPIPPETQSVLDCIRTMLPRWPPALAIDPVQRTRNLLYVAAVPDMFEMGELERWVPLVVHGYLQTTMPRDDLVRIFYWIAEHPGEGDDSASDRLRAVCLDVGGPSDVETLRERTRFYALKLVGRMTGAIQVRN